MKNPIRESFATGLSAHCADAWWTQIEAIRTGKVPRKRNGRTEDPKVVKQRTIAKHIGMDRGHLSRLLGSRPHDWPLLLLLVLD